ncbi:MAG: DUF2809 domain-containing protein [Verrucomicrobiota bacterium]
MEMPADPKPAAGMEKPRSRLLLAAGALLVICLGLAIRSRYLGVPRFPSKYGGDALWALMIVIFTAFVFPRLRMGRVALISLAICCAVEFSQIYHAPWIDAIRRSRPGALILGSVFSWWDMVAYAAGVAVGWAAGLALPPRFIRR